LETSAIEQAQAIAQTKLAVSTAKLAVEEHNFNARSAAASMAAGNTGADADLAEGLVPSEAQKDTSDALEATYNSEVFKLKVLTTRHTTILSELSLCKGTLKEVKRLIEKRKKTV
jgi:hypothetical protein